MYKRKWFIYKKGGKDLFFWNAPCLFCGSHSLEDFKYVFLSDFVLEIVSTGWVYAPKMKVRRAQ